MTVELELTRLEQLHETLGMSVPEIVSGILGTVTRAIVDLQGALSAGELDRAAKAAHSARNDAMLVGARELLAVLTEIEGAARSDEADRVRAGATALEGVWPSTRAELVRLSASG